MGSLRPSVDFKGLGRYGAVCRKSGLRREHEVMEEGQSATRVWTVQGHVGGSVKETDRKLILYHDECK